MFSNIPLPSIDDISIFKRMNALNDIQKQSLENKLYTPDKLSQIAYKNALTQGQNIENQYSPEKLRLSNELSKQVNQFYAPNIQSEINSRNALTNKTNTMLPQELLELQQKNSLYPDLTRAQINAQNAMANLRNMGGAGMGVQGKNTLQLQRQLQIDHPDWDSDTINQAASGYLSGTNTLPNGEKLPPLSGLADTFLTDIQKHKSTAALQNQAANMNVLASDINDIDITPAMKFAGLGGKINFAKYSADMAMGREVPQEFRDYVAFKNITSNFAMDALRKGFGTSVVPDYVYATLGKASQPNSTWWFDPKQVSTEWNATKNWINKNAKKYTKISTQGVGTNISGNENNDPLGIR